MKFSILEAGPWIRISTPPDVLHTQPCKLSRVASPYTNGRKPTPCTTPLTEICLAIIIIVLSQPNPLLDGFARSRESFPFIQLRCFRALHLLRLASVNIHFGNTYISSSRHQDWVFRHI